MKYNVKNRPAVKVQNLAGGQAYQLPKDLEIVGTILTSLGQGSYYESEGRHRLRLLELVHADPKLAADAALVARREFGLRSVSHLVAAAAALIVHGEQWVKWFAEAVCKRPDDVLEILACWKALSGSGKALPNSLKKGLSQALRRFDGYQLAKYGSDRHEFTLRRAINLTHPAPTPALTEFYEDRLRNVDTWEAKGNTTETWKDLLSRNKLGYLALLRNLNNIVSKGDEELTQAALTALVEPESVRLSLVLPYQFLKARTFLSQMRMHPRVLTALDKAIDLSVSNVQHYEGRTAILLDESGSMNSIFPTAALMASVVYLRSSDPVLVTFSTEARHRSYPLDWPVMAIQQDLVSHMANGGTDLNKGISVLTREKLPVDRIVILTDNESWMGNGPAQAALSEYYKAVGVRPSVANMCLECDGTTQFAPGQAIEVYGQHPRLFDILYLIQQGGTNLRKVIEGQAQKITVGCIVEKTPEKEEAEDV